MERRSRDPPPVAPGQVPGRCPGGRGDPQTAASSVARESVIGLTRLVLADAARAIQRVQQTLEANPPYGARVTFSTGERPGTGWDAPAMADWLRDSVQRASTAHFGAPPMFSGLGGSIPFMQMLGERFPEAQFLVTGVMGPGSNAHGPNEFIDLPTGVKVTACVAQVLADHVKATAR